MAKRRGCWRGSWRIPPNLLVLDEPTNDLDVETLDLLQDILGDYDGTVLLVSHDRDFIDRVATTTVAMEDGRAVIYPGGWSDYRAQRPEDASVAEAAKPVATPAASPEAKPAAERNGLSFTEKAPWGIAGRHRSGWRPRLAS